MFWCLVSLSTKAFGFPFLMKNMKKINLFTIILILIAATIFSFIFLKIMLWTGFLVILFAIIALYFLLKKKEKGSPNEP